MVEKKSVPPENRPSQITVMSSPQQRLNSVANQLSPSKASAPKQKILFKNPDDVVCIEFLATMPSVI